MNTGYENNNTSPAITKHSVNGCASPMVSLYEDRFMNIDDSNLKQELPEFGGHNDLVYDGNVASNE